MSVFAMASTPQRGYHSMRFSVDAEPPHAAPHRSASMNGLEVVVDDVAADGAPEVRALQTGVPEVEAG
jgi:hypothetical protein